MGKTIWVEESFTNFDQGINWRSYVVCDVAYNSVNNWLWTPFIDRGEANRIAIEVRFSLRDCSLFPGMALSCKETFSLLYYEFDAATKEPPPWEPESYRVIDRIAADEGRFTSTSEVIINTETRSVPVTKKGVYFAFRDQGACLSLIAVRIYYVTCPNITENLAHFPETPTGSELTAIVPAEGSCVPNAVVVGDTPRYLCKGDGNWTLPTGGCKCKKGFEAVGQSCQVYGEKCMDIKIVRKWCREFNEGRINVHDEQRSGRPSLPESTVARIDEMVRANRRITLEEIEYGLNEDCSHFSVHKIVSETLGYRKVSARWVDKWLKEAAGEWYNTGITKLVDRMKKVIEHQGDYLCKVEETTTKSPDSKSRSTLISRLRKNLCMDDFRAKEKGIFIWFT
ncbi:EPHA5 [Cordylochernes scorpioides]|uniref:EPHA5 n=1 Tax=Cordylochernes scorpioides TaxID=51811 RepID=A0ABY6LLL8_9ARAC|nr:EPHA5 [Cordylochernes scorpioides]